MNISKAVWGKYYWSVFHIASLGYPEKPLISDKENFKQFYISFGDVIPCQKCSKNYKRHLTELPLESYLENKNKLFQWTVMIHNIVNRELGKSQWDESYAFMYYSNFNDNDKKTTEKEEIKNINNNSKEEKEKHSENCVNNKESITSDSIFHNSIFSNSRFFIIILNIIIIMFIIYFLVKHN